MAEAGGEAGIGKGSLRASDALCTVKRGGAAALGLGLESVSGVVAADGAIARRRRSTAGGAILSKPLTYYAWKRRLVFLRI